MGNSANDKGSTSKGVSRNPINWLTSGSTSKHEQHLYMAQLKKLIGLPKDKFDELCNSTEDRKQILLRPARLIPVLKTGDERALTSIFLSALRLVKEFKQKLFREIKLPSGGKVYYFTEVCFPQIDDKSYIDGMVIIVKSGKIVNAAFFEMKSKTDGIDKDQIERYTKIAKTLGVSTMVTVSNEFVSDPTNSPVKARVPKGVSLFHFSWTYLLTSGHLLLFKNESTIKDEDQVEIMREVLDYLEHPSSGVMGHHQMSQGWKELCDDVAADKKLKANDKKVTEAVQSWIEEQKDMALALSRDLGVMVKPNKRDDKSIGEEIKRLIESHHLKGTLSVKGSVSNISIDIDFKMRAIKMFIKVSPPMDKGNRGKVTWMRKQVEVSQRKTPIVFDRIDDHLWIEANIKHARENEKTRLSRMDSLSEIPRDKEIQAFRITFLLDLGKAKFGSRKKFAEVIERMLIDFYGGVVQHMTNWNRPAPKLERNSEL